MRPLYDLSYRGDVAYLLALVEDAASEAPDDGGGGVTGSLTGQRDLLIQLRCRLVCQESDLGLYYTHTHTHNVSVCLFTGSH